VEASLFSQVRFLTPYPSAMYLMEIFVFVEGAFYSERGMRFCVSCWEDSVWDEDKALETVRLSLSSVPRPPSIS